MLRRNPPIRSACDNCHDLKTRCSRDGQSADCQRCLRLELTCSYSASRRMGRPKCNGGGRTQEEPVRITSPRNFPRGFQSAAMNNTGIDNAQLGQLGRMSFTASQQASSDEYLRERQLVDSLYAGHPGGGAGMGNSNIQGHTSEIESDSFFLHASPFAADDLGDMLSFTKDNPETPIYNSPHSERQPSPQSRLDVAHRETENRISVPRPINGANFDARAGDISGSTPAAPRITDSGKCPLHRLSGLQEDLHRILASMHRADNDEGSPNGSFHSRPPPNTRLDEIFAATDIFSGILTSLLSPGPSRQAPPSPPGSLGTPTTPTSDPVQASDPPDIATLLVVASCYLRLLNIYTALLTRSREAPATPGYIQEAFGPAHHHHHPLPVVSVGSFSLVGLPELNVAINLHLISEMFNRAQSLAILCFQQAIGSHSDAEHFESPRTPDREDYGPPSPMASLAEIAMKQVQQKEQHVSAALRSISENLQFPKSPGIFSGAKGF